VKDLISQCFDIPLKVNLRFTRSSVREKMKKEKEMGHTLMAGNLRNTWPTT